MSAAVSVVIACYNASATIAEAIASARAQSFPNLEIVVIDDGSSDDSAAVVAALGREDDRVRLVRQPNGGVASARNRGIEVAQGGYIAFLDADDRWPPQHLAAHIARLEADPSCMVSFGRARFIDALGRETGQRSRLPRRGLAAADFLAGNPCTTCSTMVVRRSLFGTVGTFSPTMRYAEDQEWLLRVMLAGQRIEGAAEPLVDYRINPHGLSAELPRMLEGFEAVLATARRLQPRFAERHGPLARARMLRYAARRALRLDQDPRTARRWLRRALQASPRLLLAEPRATLLTAAAAFLPRGFRHD